MPRSPTPSRLLAPSLVALALLGAGCVAAPSGDRLDEPLGEAAQAIVAKGDWTGFTSGQCVHGVYQFYLHRFGLDLTGACAQPGNLGTCENCGACMIWKSSAVAPDPKLFNRYDWGTTLPQTYDIVVYPPKSGTGPGHVACADQMTSADPADWGSLYVMDSNYVGFEEMAKEVHTVSRAPYGFYRLKSLDAPPNAAPTGALDAVSCDGGARGWAQDPDAKVTAIAVHVYFDAPAGKPGGVGVPTEAALDRPDLCDKLGSCNHGFTLPVPRSLMDGNPHPVWAYGIDTAGGTNTALAGGPQTITCAPPAPPAGVKRWIPAIAVLDAWKLSTLIDLAHEPDPVIAALPDGPSWADAPVLVQSDDGSPDVWLIDGSVRRHLLSAESLAAWRFDVTAIQMWPAAQLSSYPEGLAFRPAPFLVQGSTDKLFVIDAPPGTTPSSGAGGAGGAESTAGSGGAHSGAGGGAATAPNGASGACSASPAPGPGAPGGLVAAAMAGLFAFAHRRRDARRFRSGR